MASNGSPIRVGFVLAFEDAAWLGGTTYYRNLLSAIHELSQRKIEPVIIVPGEAAAGALDGFPPFEVLRTPLVDVRSRVWKVRRGLQRYGGRDVLFEMFLRRHGITMLSHSGHLGKSCPIPTLPWIPDFQELHFPNLFSAAERAKRASIAAECCTHATAILLSSNTAARDLAAACPACRARSETLPFVATFPDAADVTPRAELEARYGFTGRYVYLPNQFWIHKNHGVVLEALALLRKSGHDIPVLASGNTSDYRHPDYFVSLQQRATELGVAKLFRPLGVVPYRDLMGLMRESVALLNPSLFEGWSTTVEEAKSGGKAIILSDIPTHVEQSPGRGTYFAANDPASLATAMLSVWQGWDENEDRRSMQAARALLPARRNAFAERYQEIVVRLAAPVR